MSDDERDKTGNKRTRPGQPRPPFKLPRPTTAADIARGEAMAKHGKRVEEMARKIELERERGRRESPPAPPKLAKPLPVINVDEDPQNANWLRILARQRQQEQPQLAQEQESTLMADDLSSRPWDGGAENYPDANAYCAACLVDTNEPGKPKTKGACHLPVREPGGAYNRAGLGAAAAALAGARGGGVQLPPAQKKSAARKLANLYARFNLPLPDSLKSMTR